MSNPYTKADAEENKDGAPGQLSGFYLSSTDASLSVVDPELPAEEVEKPEHPPNLSYLAVFAKFLSFGMRAFGGPAAQINMMKEELVDDEKWISKERWNRVYSLYQIVPGPEAFELACYFGFICKRQLGAMLSGLGFALPGVLLELLCSYLYTQYGLTDPHVRASFRCVQVVVSAFIFRASYKLSETALTNHTTKQFIWDRGFICLWNYLVRGQTIHNRMHKI